MNKLTSEKCRELLKERYSQRDNGDISIGGAYTMQALEIALPMLEQPEGDGDVFIVMRNPGKVPDIKRPVGDVADYLLQLYRHNPDAFCDVVTYRFAGVSGQWVQDGRELLAMAGVALEQQEKGNDGWIEWCGGECAPVTGIVEVRWSTGSTDIGHAGVWRWEHSKFMTNIIAYRVIENEN